MRLAAIALALLLATQTLAAQELDPAKKNASSDPPDYTRPTLIRMLSEEPKPPDRHPNVTFRFGSVEFRALGTRWRIAYLPFMMPFSGSYNTGRGFGSDFPDPFMLTGTEIPYTAKTWRDKRAMSGELKRIERSERERQKIKVTMQESP